MFGQRLDVVGKTDWNKWKMSGEDEVEDWSNTTDSSCSLPVLVLVVVFAMRWLKIVKSASDETNGENLSLPTKSKPNPSSLDICPVVDGMQRFGISKGLITRAIVKFHEPPEKQPQTVCFHFPGTFLTHRYVLDMVRAQLRCFEGARVQTLQFVERNTIHGTRGLDNRWLVKVNSQQVASYLVRVGINLYNRRIYIRYYDDVLAEEYSEYLKYKQQMSTLAGQTDVEASPKNTSRPTI